MKKNIIRIIISTLITIFVSYGVIYAWVGLTASNGDLLGSTQWNQLVDKVAGVNTVGGNVGIGTTSPGAKLDVSGNIKATNIETNGSYVYTYLNQCGGPCGSYHAINTWINVGSYGYNWSTPTNTDTSTFTSNNRGVITINKTGLYLVHENIMMIPNSDRARIAHGCPFINGSANCGINSPTDYVTHRYYPSGWWAAEHYDLYFQLNAGDTVSYGYYIYGAMTYWAHDSYTSMRITRIN